MRRKFLLAPLIVRTGASDPAIGAFVVFVEATIVA